MLNARYATIMTSPIISSIALTYLLLFSGFTEKSDYVYEYLDIVDLTFKPIIEVTLNGQKAYFMIDTGSDVTILNSRDTRKYGFGIVRRAFSKHTLVGMGGSVSTIYSTYDVELQVGSSEVFNRYLAHDLSQVVKRLEEKINIKISGIIGSDLMKRYGFVIDYANLKVGLLTHKTEELVDAEEMTTITNPLQ